MSKNLKLLNIFLLSLFIVECNIPANESGQTTVPVDSTLNTDEDSSEKLPFLDTANTNSGNAAISPDYLLEQIKNKEVKVLFHGLGTEPFWDIYLTEKELLLISESLEAKEIYSFDKAFDKNLRSQTITYAGKNGKKYKLQIKKEPTGDGMSEMTFPYAVLFDHLYVAGDSKLHQFYGAGDSKLMTNWKEYGGY